MDKKKVGLIILLILFIVIIGTIGYRFTEGLSIFDALWLAVVSMLTIGYGDLTPETTEGKIFTLILIPIAIALTTYLLTQLAGTIIKEKFSNEVRKKIIMKKVNKLKNHIIICGYGEVGKKVVEQLRKTDHQLVIIEEKQELVNELEGDFYAIAGDATEEVTLLQAGVKEASVIIITLPSDSDNVFMTLTVKGLNPSINVITRSKKEYTEEKLYRAGADKVINTNDLSGKRMAMAVNKPTSVEFINTVFHDKEKEYNIEEMIINKNANLIGKTMRDSNIKEKFGVTIVAIKRGEEIISNPELNEEFQSEDLLLVFGTSEQLAKFGKVVS